MRPVNLLPVRHRPRSAGGADSRASYVALGVLGALVLAVFVYVSAANSVSSRTSEIDRVRQEIAAAESQAVTLQSYGDFAGIKAARVEAVKALATTRLDWERLFRELAHVLPERVWLTNFDGTMSSGETGTGTGAETPGGPSVNLQGCAASHSGVADVMVRLRQLHGAADVVLSKSSKAGGGGAQAGVSDAAAPATDASGGADCGPYTSFDIDVTLSAAESAPVSPDEQTEVPASLGGGE